jgi:hypothetical protein
MFSLVINLDMSNQVLNQGNLIYGIEEGEKMYRLHKRKPTDQFLLLLQKNQSLVHVEPQLCSAGSMDQKIVRQVLPRQR